jgi:DNA-binding winged helix-turn-helix (wHTH) protein/TolB-like protein
LIFVLQSDAGASEGRILLFLFDNFILDIAQRELRRDGGVVALQPQVFDLLEYLIRRRDRVVTKDELIEAIWRGRIVSESTLASRINAVRTAVGDSGEAQQLVRTLPRKGFRFVGAVREADKADGLAVPASVENSPTLAPTMIDPAPAAEPSQLPAIRRDQTAHETFGRWAAPNARTLAVALVLAAALACAPLAAHFFYWRGDGNKAALRVPALIGVLPFEPLDASPETRTMAALLSDDFVNALARVSPLQVVSRLASRPKEGRPQDVAAVGAELAVGYLLDGAVRIEQDRLHLNVELIDARSGLQIWSQQFERGPADSGVTRQDIVRGLCRVLEVAMVDLNNRLVAARPPHERNIQEMVAAGWGALYGTTASNTFPQAEAAFREALKRDPDQISAMLGLAAHHIIAVGNLVVPEREPYLAQADELLDRILIREPGLSAPYYYRGLLQKLRGELQPALTSFERSVAIDPSFAPAYGQIGQVLTSLGRPAEGLEQIRYAMRLSPEDPTMPSWDIFAGQAELELGHDAEGLQWLLRAVALSPGSRYGIGSLAAAYALIGDHANAELYAAKFKALTKGVSNQRRLELFGAFLPPPSPHRNAEGLRLALGDSGGL